MSNESLKPEAASIEFNGETYFAVENNGNRIQLQSFSIILLDDIAYYVDVKSSTLKEIDLNCPDCGIAMLLDLGQG